MGFYYSRIRTVIFTFRNKTFYSSTKPLRASVIVHVILNGKKNVCSSSQDEIFYDNIGKLEIRTFTYLIWF